MKHTVIIITIVISVISGFFHAAQAQQRIEEKTFSADMNEKIRLNLKFGESIVIRGWDRNEVSFRAVVEINSGKLNDAFVMNFSDGSGGIRIDTDFDKDKLEEGRAEDCPDRGYSSYSWNDDGHHKVICSDIAFEIYVPRNSDMQLETIAANVELYDLNGPIDAKSISGYVDLSWPERNGAEISLQTVTGEAYSDLENLRFNNRKEEFPLVGYELRGAIGSGGPLVKLESVSGDVYLRKMGG